MTTTATEYTEGQTLWSRNGFGTVTVDVQNGNLVMMTDEDGNILVWTPREVHRSFTTESVEPAQLVEPEDEPCDLEW